MKNLILLWLSVIFISTCLYAQVGINNDGTSPHNSAMLDVKSSGKGFLPPRMTHAEMATISAPADGLVVYCSDCGLNGLGALTMFMYGQWYTLGASCLLPSKPIAGTHVPSVNQITWNWNPVADATGCRWSDFPEFTTAIEMGTATTYTETGLACNHTYTRYVWSYNSCGHMSYTVLTQTTLPNPAAPVSATHVASPTQIIWNWNPGTDATGYKWNTANNYATAIDMGTATTKTETGLTCNWPYYRWVWAYNNCGNSTSIIINQNTTVSPAQPVAATHVAASSEIIWNWNTVPGATGYKWNTANNYATATDNGASLSKTESGLACNTSYSRYIWAYSPCGNSIVTMTAQSTAKNPASPVTGVHVPAVTQILWKWDPVTGATGYKWSTANNYATATNVGTALSQNETGLTCNTSYDRYVWAYNACGSSTATTLTQTTSMTNIPAAPVAGTHTFTTSQITWTWNAVSGAAGYKWNSVNDYTTAVNMGTALTKTELGLTCATAYTRYVWAYTSCGVSTPTVLSQTTVFCIWICGMPLTDNRDGKIYGTQLIGTRCWMDQNLNIGIDPGFGVAQTNNGIIEKYCRSNVSSNCNLYGGLYEWDEMMNYAASSNANPSGRQGICPAGWHIPSDAEWCELEVTVDASVICNPSGSFLGTDVGGKLKEAGTTHWSAPNTGATNSSGFNALPSSYTWDHGTGSGAPNVTAYFFTATENSSTANLAHVLYHDSQQTAKLALLKATNYGTAVRCVKD